MTKFSLLLPLILLSSCTWVATHPKEDMEIILSAEEIARDLYQYESRTLSPAPPQPHVHHDLPPFKPKAPNAI